MSNEEVQKTNRPPEDAFHQQKLRAWKPIMTPLKVVLLFVAIGVSFIPAGVSIMNQSDKLYEKVIVYDGSDMDVDCRIYTPNEGKQCTVSVTLSEDVDGPVNVYYGMDNFFQNHRRYVSSVDTYQLAGEDRSKADLDTACVEFVENDDGQLINPCGLIANSYFTDIITLNHATLKMDESDIAWKSDKDKFKQPDGFQSKAVPSSAATCEEYDLPSSCKSYNDPKTGQDYLFYYPHDDNTQYLYETYPGLISPIEGVTNQHFKVWMRTAALPSFRKLYGQIDEDLKKGEVLNFQITANYEVESFDASKSLIIANVGPLGGKNPNLGIAFIVVGSVALFMAVLLTAKQLIAPRPKASAELLKWQ